MTALAPTASQIRAQVAAIRQRVPDARVIGICAPGRWTGERCLKQGQEVLLIHQCDSPLAMRLALREVEDDPAVRVLITPLEEGDLEDDILLRLAKRRLFPIDSWQIVKALFQAHSIDPRLTRHRWIADTLIDWVPAERYRPAPGGFLDAETVWPILLDCGMGLDAERPDLPALLKWSISTEHVQRFRERPEEFRSAAAEWLALWAGPAVEVVLRCVATSDRPDALPVGLAVGVVFHREAAGRLDKAAGRIEERFLGGAVPNEEVLRRWSAAAAEVAIRLRLTDPNLGRERLQRADEIMREVGADGWAYLSDTSPQGFDQRLADLGRCLAEFLGAKDPTAALKAVGEKHRAVLRHYLVSREGRRLERIDMAIRLMRWLASLQDAAIPQPRSFAEAVAYQAAEGSYVDWARLTLRSGDPVRELSDALGQLFERVTQLREQQACQFAQLLKDWTAAGSTGDAVVPVEQVLAIVVAPLAARAPVLVIVIDGMTTAVSRELLADVAQHDWVVLRETGWENAPLAALATIPSVTEVSRTSLLCGKLCRGTAENEKAGFASHRALLQHCRSGYSPVLFHKASLQEGEGATLAGGVREAIAAPGRRVVGVVINAVDDHLAKGEQIDTHWTRDEIKVLPALLQEARDARRVVVLVCDHGHILECGTRSTKSEAGERWRLDDGSPTAHELQISGSRVVSESGTLIAPWSERIRYGANKKNGYHGGLTPQEMVAPIVVLSSATPYPEGWLEAAVDTPTWWEETINEPQRKWRPPQKIDKAPPPGLLFDPDEEGIPENAHGAVNQPSPEWVIRLLASPVFQEQVKPAGALAIQDDLVRLLTVLDYHGGQLSSAALCRATSCSPNRLRDLLAAAGRVLNVDGFSVLACDEASDSIVLDRELLCRQFDLV